MAEGTEGVQVGKSSLQSGLARKINVYLVRHSERADEVKDVSALQNASQNLTALDVRVDVADPPLTSNGIRLAAECGKRLKGLKNVKFETVYTSPFIRTLQTASEVAVELEISITPVVGVGSCAAFVKEVGVEKVLRDQYFVNRRAQETICGETKIMDTNNDALNFRESLESILINMVKSKSPFDNALFVTHREGIYDMIQDKRGCGIDWAWGTPEYCGCFVLQFKYIDQGESSTPYKKWKLKTPRDAFETMDKRYNREKKKRCVLMAGANKRKRKQPTEQAQMWDDGSRMFPGVTRNIRSQPDQEVWPKTDDKSKTSPAASQKR